jgi:prophage antirepressor-like protein
MSNITPFHFGDSQVRTLTDEQGIPQFVGVDVTAALGYSNSRDALSKHVDKEDKSSVAIHDGTSGNPEKTVINESGVFSLALSSKLKQAKQFKRWVTSEVLPSIRKHGAYVSPNADAEGINNAMTPDQRLEFLGKSMSLMERLGELPSQDKEMYRASIRALTLEVQPQHEFQAQPQQELTEQRYWSVQDVAKEMGHSLSKNLSKNAGFKAYETHKRHYGSEPKQVIQENNGNRYSKRLYTEKDFTMVKSCIQEAVNQENEALRDYGLNAAVDNLRDQNGNH